MILGICLEKGGLHYSVVSGTKDKPVLQIREKLSNPESDSLAKSMNWHKQRLEQLIRKHSDITVVNVKFHYSISSMKSMITHGLPLGIIALFANEHNLDINLVTKQKLKSHKHYGLQEGTDPFKWVDHLKDSKSYWNDAARTGVLLGIFGLD